MTRTSARVLTVLALAAAFATPSYAADPVLRPYVLGFRGASTPEAKRAEVRSALEQKGFQVVGEYEPAKGVDVLVVTSDALKAAAAKSAFGAYGAVVRVAITDTGKELQVAATNPRYYAAAYRMKDGLDDVALALEQALGKTADFGSKDGMTAAKLRQYHYMMMMPHFDNAVKLASYGSHDQALAAVEAGLAAKKAGASKVYRVDVPGGKESVFGVAIPQGEGADDVVLRVIDLAELKHAPHLPYEVVVSEGTVWMLHGKFRIAVDFPDLSMGKFMKISGAPSAIEKTLRAVAAGK